MLNFDKFTAEVPVQAITPAASQDLAPELQFQTVQSRDDIPAGAGVYMWAMEWVGAVLYIGCGSGVNGLWSRLGNQLRWVAEAREGRSAWEQEAAQKGLVPNLMAANSLIGLGWVPLVRNIVERGLVCFAAPIPSAAAGDADTASGLALMWEKRFHCANRLVSGNSSILGGSAWELKGHHWTEAEQWAQEAVQRAA